MAEKKLVKRDQLERVSALFHSGIDLRSRRILDHGIDSILVAVGRRAYRADGTCRYWSMRGWQTGFFILYGVYSIKGYMERAVVCRLAK